MSAIADPVWYGAWRQDAIHELVEKNQKLSEEFQLGSWQRFDFNFDKGLLVFSNEGKPIVRASVQVVGTVASGKDWLWAWANDWWSQSVIRNAQHTRQFGEEHGIGELKTPSLRDADLESLGWELSAVSARVTSALGAYRAPTEKGLLFVLFTDIRFLT